MADDENNSADLSNLSIEQITEMFKDVVEFPDGVLIADCSKAHYHTCAMGGGYDPNY